MNDELLAACLVEAEQHAWAQSQSRRTCDLSNAQVQCLVRSVAEEMFMLGAETGVRLLSVRCVLPREPELDPC
jgi:hypothetical protein